MSDRLVLAAHPDLADSRVTRQLVGRARTADGVALRDLYDLYPDYLVDVAAERAALADARLVVLLHPLHWWGMPALLKLWVDEVLGFGWAYGAPGAGAALAGKHLWLVSSAGSSAASFAADGAQGAPLDAFLLPYRGIARLCGMHWLPPLILHDAHRADAAALRTHAERFSEGLRDWPAWTGAAGTAPTPLVPTLELDDRPAPFSPYGTRER